MENPDPELSVCSSACYSSIVFLVGTFKMKMDRKTFLALKRSIKHWEKNVDANTPDEVTVGTKYCALCKLFCEIPGCEGCPVSAATGEGGCLGSPYRAAVTAYSQWGMVGGRGSPYRREDFKSAARIEYNFLKALLPEEEPMPVARKAKG